MSVGSVVGRVVALAALLAGCASIGSQTLPRDRFDYSSALAESWKYQTLLNVVKLRYMDTPIFVDVAQVVSAYQLETQVNVTGTLRADSILGNLVSGGALGRYTDRPTITYSPLTGDQYIRGIMTPIRPEAIFSVLLAGWPADAVLFTSVTSINGLSNQRFGGRHQRAGDPGFFRLIGLVRMLQEAGTIGFSVKEGKEEKTNILFFRKENLTPEEEAAVREARQLLRLHPDEHEFHLVFGPTAPTDRHIAVQTRSLIEIMSEAGAQADLPPAHVSEGRATPGFADTTDGRPNVRFMRIHSSRDRADSAHVSIRYRDHWFWIDDRDLVSKRNFVFLMLLFSLADTGEKRQPPLIDDPRTVIRVAGVDELAGGRGAVPGADQSPKAGW